MAALGPVVAPVLRSMTSKLVPVEERGKMLMKHVPPWNVLKVAWLLAGKMFALLSVCDNAVPLFSGILYSQLYNATINTAPSSIYWLTFSTQVSLLLLIL